MDDPRPDDPLALAGAVTDTPDPGAALGVLDAIDAAASASAPPPSAPPAAPPAGAPSGERRRGGRQRLPDDQRKPKLSGAARRRLEREGGAARGGDSPSLDEWRRERAAADEARAALEAERAAHAAALERLTVDVDPKLSAMFGRVVGLVFDGVALKAGAHWRLETAERDALGEAWALALAPWVKDVAEWMPGLAALGLTTAVVFDRVQEGARRQVPAREPASHPGAVAAAAAVDEGQSLGFGPVGLAG